MAMSNSPRRAKPKPNTIQSISNLNKFQGSEELLAHPERWIGAAERQPQPTPPPQHIRRAARTGTSSRSTLPTHLASDASQRNRNRNRIRDLIRGSPHSGTQVQAHEPIRHLLRDQTPSRMGDRSLSQRQKQAAMAMYATTIAAPTAPIDINIATAALTPESDKAVPSATSPSPPHRPYIPPPPFRGSVLPPQPSQPKREREEELRTLATETRKRSDRGIGSYTKLEHRTLTTQMRERADRRDGSGRYPMFVPGPLAEWHTEVSGREVVDTSGVYNTEEGPRRALQALRQAVALGWTSRGRREEDVELVGRQTWVEVEDGRDGIREGAATTSSTSASRKKSKNAGEGGAIADQCKPPPIHRPSTTNPTSAHREPGPLNIRPASENWALEAEEDAKRLAEEERLVSKRSGNGMGFAERVAKMNTNIDRRMRGPDGSGLEIAVEEAAEDAEWVLVPVPAPAATNLQDAMGEEVEVENEAEWCVVRT